MLAIDHVVLPVLSLEDARDRIRREHGLKFSSPQVSDAGGFVNCAALFDDLSYIELVAVVDRSTRFGGQLAEWLETRGEHLAAWAVRTANIEAEAARLGTEIVDGLGTGRYRDGSVGRFQQIWHPATAPARRLGSPFPFFISYHPPDAVDWPTAQRQRFEDLLGGELPSGGLRWVEVSALPQSMDAWLGEHDVDVRCRAGSEGVVAVGGMVDGSEFILRPS